MVGCEKEIHMVGCRDRGKKFLLGNDCVSSNEIFDLIGKLALIVRHQLVAENEERAQRPWIETLGQALSTERDKRRRATIECTNTMSKECFPSSLASSVDHHGCAMLETGCDEWMRDPRFEPWNQILLPGKEMVTKMEVIIKFIAFRLPFFKFGRPPQIEIFAEL